MRPELGLDPEDLPSQERGQTQRGLIHQEQLGSCHPTSSQGQHLLFPAREGSSRLLHPLFQPGEDLKDEV